MDQSSSSTANSYADYQAMVIQVSTALEALESLCGDLSLEENRRELEKCRKKLLDHTFTVGVMGEFKRGKSTVINALLVALGLHRKGELSRHLKQLESIWDEHSVYLEEESRHG